MLAGKNLASLSFKECCRILGVAEDASTAEVKRAFRKKAKRLHPDVSPHAAKKEGGKGGESIDSSAEMLILLEAYRTLCNPEAKKRRDAQYEHFRSSRAAKGFDYRLWLLSREDGESRAKLIFFDLLHGFEEEAVSLYLKWKGGKEGFQLSAWLEREDYMDCGFILAEELDARGEAIEAFALLEGIAECERQKPYFRHFFPEALSFLMAVARKIGQQALRGEMPCGDALECLKRALEAGLPPKDSAFILFRMAECSARLGMEDEAAFYRSEAERLSAAKTLAKMKASP